LCREALALSIEDDRADVSHKVRLLLCRIGAVRDPGDAVARLKEMLQQTGEQNFRADHPACPVRYRA